VSPSTYRALLLLPALAGCPWIGDELHAQRMGEDTEPVGDPPAIDLVDPAFGPTGVETDVTIVGGPFEPGEAGNYLVEVGGVQARVLSVEADALVVRFPALQEAGPVDVVVEELGVGATTAEDAYTTWQNRQGLIGVHGYVARIGGPFIEGYTTVLAFPEPLARPPWAPWAPSLDTCESGLADFDWRHADIGADALQLVSPSGLQWTVPNTGDAYRGSLDPGDAQPSWRLEPIEGTSALPPYAVDPLVTLPPRMVPTQPDLTGSTRLFRNAGGGGGPDIGGANDFVTLVLWTTDFNGNQTGAIRCALVDDGRFRVPPALLTHWVSGEWVDVEISRARSADSVLPHDLSENQVLGVDVYYGRAIVGE
jgi:hypothetical protein